MLIQKRRIKATTILSAKELRIQLGDDVGVVSTETLPEDILKIEDFGDRLKRAAGHIKALNDKTVALNKKIHSKVGSKFEITLNYLV